MEKTTTGTLVDGFTYKEAKQLDFTLNATVTAGDLFDAEIEAESAYNELAFKGALLARQLINIGECKGPFTLQQIRALSAKDYGVLRAAQRALEAEVNSDPNASSDEESGSPSHS